VVQTCPHFPSYGNRSWWGSAEPAEREYLFRPGGTGWRLSRRDFEASFATAASRRGAEWHYGARVASPVRSDGAWKITITRAGHREICRPDFLIDATGRCASLARAIGISRMTFDRLVGIAANLRPVHSSITIDSFTAVEAVESGWWYSALQPDGSLAVIFFTDHDLESFAAASSREGWLRALRSAPNTWERAAGFGHLTSPLRIFAAGSARLRTVAGDDWLAAGDAAAAHDPLSSYGIVAAMGSGYYAGCAARDLLEDRPLAQEAYSDLIERAWTAYRHLQADSYLAERRWPTSLFWQRFDTGLQDRGCRRTGILRSARR
jgi:flavin-dependent dehydrogenase